MTVISDQAPPGQDYLLRRLRDLERQVRELQAGRRLEAATIRGGSLKVLDDQGQLQIQLGLLPDGTYGLAAVDADGKLVTLAGLAFGLRADTDPAQGSRTASDFGDLTGAAVGPAVNVTIGSTGRCIVILGCKMSYGDAFAGGLMGYTISGATTRTATVDESMESSITAENQVFSASKAFLVEGLNPGVNTITAKYASAANGVAALFESRHLIAMPY